jgi:RDD family
MMTPRFETDSDEEKESWPARISSDSCDAAGVQFAARLDRPRERARPEFFPDCTEPQSGTSNSIPQSQPVQEVAKHAAGCTAASDSCGIPSPASVMTPDSNPDSWRGELSARLRNYRARRHPKPPRYPSLRLKFEAYDTPAIRLGTASLSPPPVSTRESPVLDGLGAAEQAELPPVLPLISEVSNIIEFPRASIAPRGLDELAEPVLDHPRIVEVPEIVPPPPALGGILILPAEEPINERRPGFEIPLQPASTTRRVVSIIADLTLVILAFTLFAYLFLKVTATIPRQTQTVGMAAGLMGVFWIAYQYLLLVQCGTTPGLKLAKLELHRFDGRAVPRNIRRWRVLASVLSGLSLGIGYAWCLLDEDQLCWHDRITRTYMAPRNQKNSVIESLRD